MCRSPFEDQFLDFSQARLSSQVPEDSLIVSDIHNFAEPFSLPDPLIKPLNQVTKSYDQRTGIFASYSQGVNKASSRLLVPLRGCLPPSGFVWGIAP